MAKEGSKRVDISGIDDKKLLVCMAVAWLEISYQFNHGKTPRCIPSFNFPPDWDITFTHNHRCNERTVKDYIEKILVPYITRKREELKLKADHRALVMYDVFRGQCTQAILELLDTNNIYVVFVPPNCTDRLQPLDVSLNKPAKVFLRDKFQEWYAQQVCKQLEGEKTMIDV